jgi:hypothetical protein
LQIEGQGTPTDKIDIQPAIIVEIEERNASAHGIPDEKSARRTWVILKLNACSNCNVLELDPGIWTGHHPG